MDVKEIYANTDLWKTVIKNFSNHLYEIDTPEETDGRVMVDRELALFKGKLQIDGHDDYWVGVDLMIEGKLPDTRRIVFESVEWYNWFILRWS